MPASDASTPRAIESLRGRLPSAQGRLGAISGYVSHDQRQREEEQAENEVAEEAVSLAAGDTGWPEGQSDPDTDEHDSQHAPSERGKCQHLDHGLTSIGG